MSNTQTSTSVLPEEIKDYRPYQEGQVFPLLGKKIHILIVVESAYIVFLDEEFHVHWYYNSAYGDFAEGFGDVLARQADLEATSSLLLKKPHLEAQRRMLGEAIARLLDDRCVTHANLMLKKAAEFLEARSLERARIWFLGAMIFATSILLVAGWAFWKFQTVLLSFLAFSPEAAPVFVGFSMGSLGASLSVLLRLHKLPVDPSAGPHVHYFEGVMRVLVGAMAGAILILAVKSNILLSAINSSPNALTLMVVLSIVAGASEHLLPNFIARISSILVGEIEVATLESAGPAKIDSNGSKKPVIVEVERRSSPRF